MKRILSFLLAALMLVALTACGGETAEQPAVSRGIINGNVYTSNFGNVTFTKPDSWTYYSDAELAEAINAGVELMEQSNFAQTVDTTATVYDMMVVDTVSGNNINVAFENLKLSAIASNLDTYLAAFEKQYTELEGFNVKVGTHDEVQLGNTAFTRASFTLEYMGVQMEQYAYFRQVGRYLYYIIITINDGTPIADLEAMFS